MGLLDFFEEISDETFFVFFVYLQLICIVHHWNVHTKQKYWPTIPTKSHTIPLMQQASVCYRCHKDFALRHKNTNLTRNSTHLRLHAKMADVVMVK